MGLIHVLAGIEMSDMQGRKTRSNFNHWNPAWDTAAPGDGGAYPATALADTLAALETYQGIMATVSEAGMIGLMASEVRGFGAGVLFSGGGEPYLYGYEKLVLQIVKENGGMSQPEVPAPKSACFTGASADVMNGANGAVASLTAALVGNGVCDESGNLYKNVVSGYYDAGPNRGKHAGGI